LTNKRHTEEKACHSAKDYKKGKKIIQEKITIHDKNYPSSVIILKIRWVKERRLLDMKDMVRIRHIKMAKSLGTKVSVCSWTWMMVCRRDMTTPTTRAVKRRGVLSFKISKNDS
jgi:hypothetical protein